MNDQGRFEHHGGNDATNGREAVLEVRGVTKSFGETAAVKDLSFEVYDGEFLFLIGPSGCGKTTTLRMIGGYETPTLGDILIRGHRVNDVPLDKRNIGMVFQSYALFPHMTVQQNVEFGLRMRKVSRIERRERTMKTLELVELGDLAGRYPAQLSGGQRQRVALARVIVYEPDILLLDEPLANLDKRLRDAMRVELKKLQERVGITTVCVTHDQEEALTMADRVAVMDQGVLLQVGAPDVVYNQPATAFVATFLGETSSFRGTVERDAEGIAHLITDDGFRMALRHRADVGEGDRVMVSLRPERVRVTRERPAQSDNVFPGVMDFVSYLGSHAEYFIRLKDGNAVIRAVESIPSGEPSFRQGQEVFAAWDIENAVYIKD